jgi:hypothetical protein
VPSPDEELAGVAHDQVSRLPRRGGPLRVLIRAAKWKRRTENRP